jgi:hypothetical protein
MKSDLQAEIAGLEELAKRGRILTRHDVRPILLAIGGALSSAEAADLDATRERYRALPPEFRAAWEAAVRDELAMASTEHIRSVDPRYLDHPAYDFRYTLEARRDLDARLRAAGLTDIHIDETLSAAVGRADALLESRLARRAGVVGPPGRESATS